VFLQSKRITPREAPPGFAGDPSDAGYGPDRVWAVAGLHRKASKKGITVTNA